MLVLERQGQAVEVRNGTLSKVELSWVEAVEARSGATRYVLLRWCADWQSRRCEAFVVR